MRRYALLLGAVLAAGTAAAQTHIGIGPWWNGPNLSHPPVALSLIGGTPSSLWWASLPTQSITRPMRVSVTPRLPRTSDEVFVTISGQTSVPNLTLDSATIDRQGDIIVIDLQWTSGGSYFQLVWHTETQIQGGTAEVQTQYIGYGTESASFIASSSTVTSYEVTRSLGAFDAGQYRIYVYSHGALEGEAQATFLVRESAPSLFDLLGIDSL
jgi:hypothetical protein